MDFYFQKFEDRTPYNPIPNAADKEVEVEVRFFDDRIIFTICDVGARKPTDLPHTLDYDPEDLDSLPEGRMGLFLIHEIMDDINYETSENRNIFTMTKYLTPKQ